MSRPSLLVPAFSFALLGTACGGSSGGGSTDQASAMEIEALRHELVASGIQPMPDPPPVSDELFALGQALFFDKLLSGDEDISCATCHLPQFSTGDGRTLPSGVHGLGLGPNRGGGEIIPRNSPPLFALHLKRALFWDGHVQEAGGSVFVPTALSGLTSAMLATLSPDLEVLATQAMLPPLSRGEMRGFAGENPLGDVEGMYAEQENGLVWKELTERLLDLPGYVELLRAAYPGVAVQDFTFAHAGNAIAAFETRAFASTDSPFERFVRGEDEALTREQVRGGLVFFGVGCGRCHSGALLSDQDFHNIGLPQLGPGVDDRSFGPRPGDVLFVSDIGRENATGLAEDRFEFRTASLLDVELTAPYGHAGQFARLRDMVAHYQDARTSNLTYDIQSNVSDPALVTTLAPNSPLVLATLDPRLQTPQDFDVDAVVEFLRSLTALSALTLSDIVPASVPSGLPIF